MCQSKIDLFGKGLVRIVNRLSKITWPFSIVGLLIATTTNICTKMYNIATKCIYGPSLFLMS